MHNPPEEGVCTLRGKDAVRILEREFGVSYSLDGVYDLLERLNYSCLAPRPRHEKGDPAAQQLFKEQAPFCYRDGSTPIGNSAILEASHPLDRSD
jgi:hypothetical protein